VGEVGIDVESFRLNIEAVDIASVNFTENEAAIIAVKATQEEQSGTFLRLWTRKETVLKAAGFGIVRGLNTVDVTQLSANLVGLKDAGSEPSASCWRLQEVVSSNARTRSAQ
jgi:4'-phosphopantetheinyl transferase